MKAIAVYSRYFEILTYECESLEDAVDMLSYGSDAGELMEIGIYVPDERAAYLFDVSVLSAERRTEHICEQCGVIGEITIANVKHPDD